MSQPVSKRPWGISLLAVLIIGACSNDGPPANTQQQTEPDQPPLVSDSNSTTDELPANPPAPSEPAASTSIAVTPQGQTPTGDATNNRAPTNTGQGSEETTPSPTRASNSTLEPAPTANSETTPRPSAAVAESTPPANQEVTGGQPGATNPLPDSNRSIDTISAASQPAPAEPPTVARNSGAIGGAVSSENGAEAGVWVIAETDAFDTFFAKIVVTDDQGRFVIPDLPDAEYQIWVRGYGLLDSQKTNARPGRTLKLQAPLAMNDAEAAQVYPAAYWYAMLDLPTADEIKNVDGGLNNYLTWIKNMGCVGCHQLGQAATRTFPYGIGEASHAQAWLQRISSGQAGESMVGLVNRLNGLPIKYLADWTERIANGETPFAKPERPQGKERNLVVTVRDWSTPKAYMHDLSGTDRRNPTVNAYGALYGAPELSTDEFPILNPRTNTASFFNAPVRDADTPSTVKTPPFAPSPYWGEEHIWDSKANAHNPMLDQDGRVWYTAVIRSPGNPDFCGDKSDHPSAKIFPLSRSSRQLSIYEPDTGQYTFIDTCYSTHHLQFAKDANNTLWTSGGGPVVGWFNSQLFFETGDAVAAQGWSPIILDTNGNGKVDEWTEPDKKINPKKDARVNANFYAVMPNLQDGSVWGSNAFGYPGAVVRFDPTTGLGEKYNVPLPGFGSRGADIDKNGVVWVSLASGHLGEFDRRRCKGPLNGPNATGDHCPEGWRFHRLPGPGFQALPEQSVESSYYTFVDQHNTLGLGADIPMATGNLFDGIHALANANSNEKEFLTLRVPYPMGFYMKGFEGRIDNPDAGWKGRGLWIPSGDRTPWLKEGGKGTRPLVVHMQMRPNPLAN